jgi:hypothetical protein
MSDYIRQGDNCPKLYQRRFCKDCGYMQQEDIKI